MIVGKESIFVTETSILETRDARLSKAWEETLAIVTAFNALVSIRCVAAMARKVRILFMFSSNLPEEQCLVKLSGENSYSPYRSFC